MNRIDSKILLLSIHLLLLVLLKKVGGDTNLLYHSDIITITYTRVNLSE